VRLLGRRSVKRGPRWIAASLHLFQTFVDRSVLQILGNDRSNRFRSAGAAQTLLCCNFSSNEFLGSFEFGIITRANPNLLFRLLNYWHSRLVIPIPEIITPCRSFWEHRHRQSN
jgi:hypothetical protein